MKHSIRYRTVDPIRGQVTKVETVFAELGSGILDKNGKEIFEGDIVTYNDEQTTFPVLFKDGTLQIDSYPLDNYSSNELEIIGHVDD